MKNSNNTNEFFQSSTAELNHLKETISKAKSIVIILVENMEIAKEDENAINVLKVLQSLIKEIEEELEKRL